MSNGKQRRQKNNQQGFTLIELMIVVAIIGILAVISVPFYVEHIKKAQLSAAGVEILNARKGYEIAKALGKIPSTDPNDFGYIGVESGLSSKGGVCKIIISVVDETILHCYLNSWAFKGARIGSKYNPAIYPLWKCYINDAIPPSYYQYVQPCA